MLRIRFALSLMFVLMLSSVAAAENKTDNSGSTLADGYVNHRIEGDLRKIDLELVVTKSGVNGVGKGRLGFQLFDTQFNLMNPVYLDLTVGADMIRGTHREGTTRSLQIPKERFMGCLWFVSAEDDIGIPTNLSDLINVLKEKLGANINPIDFLKGLPVGGSGSVGKVGFIRF